MTARSGLVDDIAAALLGAALVGFGDGQDEGRSLVEEAQADAKHWQEQVEMLSAVGTGVLTEQSTELEAAQADAKSWMERSIAIQKQEEQAEHELDRLKGELAEARRLISEAFPNVRDDGLSAKLRAFVTIWPSAAATPAEQAQGEGAKHSSDCAQLEEKLGGCAADCPARAACDCTTNGVCACVPADPIATVNAQVAALARRVDELTARLDRITSPPSRPFVSEIKRHWDDPAVRDNFVDATLDDHESRLRDLEWRFKTEGEKP
jgi:hypothetical protein